MTEQGQSAAEMVAIVRRALEGLGRGDASGMAAAVADDVEYELTGQHPLSATHQGKDAFLGLVDGLMAQFESGIQYEFRRLLVAGQTVVATFRGTGKTVNGKSYDNEYCALWDFNDDLKVVRVTEFFDSHHVITTIC